ncbi:heterokaryon incompatibility protein-domain-containing protein [Sordaria brevicollis]|uniref:Heterokaryon incompatibility protein-domain-containing protein n=1 Tax=Sordaria brevicollis TaxID=83679 RepID=A0AAE0UFW9_SORBR|nr:heterokaryon incompatibility protein-domain-containing protein [Sordaria brevicollis]
MEGPDGDDRRHNVDISGTNRTITLPDITNLAITPLTPSAEERRNLPPAVLGPASSSEPCESSSITGESPKCSQRFCRWCAQIVFFPVPKMKVKWEIRITDPETCSLCAFFRAVILQRDRYLSDQSKFFLLYDRHGWILRHDNYALKTPQIPSVILLLNMHKKIPPRQAKRVALMGRKIQHLCVDYPSIKAWLHSCALDHDQCSKAHTSITAIPGLRFIDCVTEHIIPACEASEQVYVTLSYVWGASSHVSGNATAAGPASVLPACLPRVIRDAVTVTRTLGYRYLWVDRYCIPQNDRSVKHIQIQSMGSIYACSTLTIIAAAGDDAEHGLPGVTSRPRIPQLSVDLGDFSVVEFHSPRYDIESSTWSTRGWTYQEAQLARRRLVFTDNQVYFQCQERYCAEGLTGKHTSAPWTAFPWPDSGRYCGVVWCRIIEFSKRRLTFDRDALEAISGILAKYYEDHGLKDGVGFFCGLPILPHKASSVNSSARGLLCEKCRESRSEGFGGTECLVRSLLWKDYWDYATDVPSETPRRTMFPSWTWAGWKSTSQFELIVYPLPGGTLECCCADVHAVYEEGGLILNWRDCAKQILELSLQGIKPVFLDIEGPCFDVSLLWREKEGWVYREPLAFALNDRTESFPPCMLEKSEGKVQKLVGLLLMKDTDTFNHKFESVHVLLLQPAQHDVKGWVFERLTSSSIQVFNEERMSQDDGSRTEVPRRLFEAALEKRKIRLR